MKRIYILIILFSVLYAQNLGKYYEKLDSGKIREVRKEIQDLSEKQPDNPKIQLIKGIVSTDGKKAAQIFKGIIARHPNTLITEKAKVELMKYYFTLGLYLKARDRAEEFLKKHQSSENLHEVLILLLRSMRYYRDSTAVEKYRHKLAKQYPKYDTLIANINYSSPYEVVDSRSIESKKSGSINGNSVFTVQVGVFSDSENISRIKKQLQNVNYKIYIKKKQAENTSSIQVGKFSDKSKARQAAQEIKNYLQLDYVLVKRIKK